MGTEFLLYSLLFVLIGLMLVSLFLVWNWFDARDRLKVVREVTREQTIHEIHHVHNKCRILLYISLFLAFCYIPIPFILGEMYSSLVYPGVVILANILMLIGLRSRAKMYIGAIDDYVNANEEEMREARAELERERDEWRKIAVDENPKMEAYFDELLGEGYEVWFRHDIRYLRCVLASPERNLLYAQGVVVPLSDIMEVRKGRKNLKLVTSNSMNPFITIDFGVLTINPETGNKYMDEIAERLEKLMH